MGATTVNNPSPPFSVNTPVSARRVFRPLVPDDGTITAQYSRLAR
jgi:hypothetical protein